MSTPTLKQIRDAVAASGLTFDHLLLSSPAIRAAYNAVNGLFENAFHPSEACDYKYSVDYEMTDDGIVLMHTYLDSDCDNYKHAILRGQDADYPDVQWSCEVPLTRGFSDIPDKADTRLSWLDIDIATRDAIEQHEHISRVQPYELRSLMQAVGIIDDFHMEDTEVDDLISMVL